jgi:hypothetical protein
MGTERNFLIVTRVVLVLHERLAHWARQLRPRMTDPAIRWFETRSGQDLENALFGGVGCPIVLIDLERQRETALEDLVTLNQWASGARILVIDREADAETALILRELGATHVFAGFVPPPEVASLLGHWVGLAKQELERSGFFRTEFPETGTDPWSWLAEYVGDRYAPEPGAGRTDLAAPSVATADEPQLDSDAAT